MTKKKFKRKIGLLIRDLNVLNYERDQQESAISFLKKSVKVLADTNQRLKQDIEMKESSNEYMNDVETNGLRNQVKSLNQRIKEQDQQIQNLGLDLSQAEQNADHAINQAKEFEKEIHGLKETANREEQRADFNFGLSQKHLHESERLQKRIEAYETAESDEINGLKEQVESLQRLHKIEREKLSAAHNMIFENVLINKDKYQELLSMIPKEFSFEQVKKYEPRGRGDNSPCKNCGQMKWNHAVGWVCKGFSQRQWGPAHNPKGNYFQNADGSLKGGIPFGGFEDWYEREARKFNEDAGQLGYQIHIPTTCTCGDPMEEHLIEIKMTCPKDLKKEEPAKTGPIKVRIITERRPGEYFYPKGKEVLVTQHPGLPDFWVDWEDYSSPVAVAMKGIHKSDCEVIEEDSIKGFWPKPGEDMICRNCGKTREEHLHSRICI